MVNALRINKVKKSISTKSLDFYQIIEENFDQLNLFDEISFKARISRV